MYHIKRNFLFSIGLALYKFNYIFLYDHQFCLVSGVYIQVTPRFFLCVSLLYLWLKRLFQNVYFPRVTSPRHSLFMHLSHRTLVLWDHHQVHCTLYANTLYCHLLNVLNRILFLYTTRPTLLERGRCWSINHTIAPTTFSTLQKPCPQGSALSCCNIQIQWPNELQGLQTLHNFFSTWLFVEIFVSAWIEELCHWFIFLMQLSVCYGGTLHESYCRCVCCWHDRCINKSIFLY